jgi:hypothetical protein
VTAAGWPAEPVGVAGTVEDAGAGATVVHYHFPVEIEVRESAVAADPEAAVEIALRRLAERLYGL